MRENTVYNLRTAQDVRRYHTWPTIQQQTVGAHTYGVLLLYILTFGNPSPKVLLHIIKHDLPEVVTGDLPFPVKKLHPKIGLALDPVERDTLLRLGFDWEADLPEEDKLLVKVADLLEMVQFGMKEIELGNRHHIDVVHDTLEVVRGMEYKLTQGHWTAVKSQVRHMLDQHTAIMREPVSLRYREEAVPWWI